MLSRKNDGRFVWEGWHAFRERARKTEWTTEVFSDIEKERYDLDTARITGEDNEELGVEEPYSDRLDEYDIREEDPRRA